MKNILKVSLAAIAISALAACGGGGSSDVADAYVGNWKSNCYSYKGNDGGTYYATEVVSMTKSSAAELAGSFSNATAHTDSGCKNILGSISNSSPAKFNIGADTTFLGAAARAMVMTLSDGQARQGFITADATKMSLVVTDATGLPPAGWGSASPYTKQ
jgi:hypothetical protein